MPRTSEWKRYEVIDQLGTRLHVAAVVDRYELPETRGDSAGSMSSRFRFVDELERPLRYLAGEKAFEVVATRERLSLANAGDANELEVMANA